MGGCVRKSNANAVTPKQVSPGRLSTGESGASSKKRKHTHRREVVNTESGTTNNVNECLTAMRTDK